MAVISARPPGTFCWPELSTTDVDGAKKFYGELLGWQANDLPVGPDASYAMMQVDGHDAAAVCSQRDDERARKVPARWSSYVAVTSADESTRRISDAGGEILAPPFDVVDSGRMAVVKDPTGAVLSLWQPRKHPGATWGTDPGAMIWNELLTRDTATASQFYARAFGWAAEAQAGPVAYTVFKLAGRSAGGMTTIPDDPGGPQPPPPPFWNVYFAVADCDASIKTATGLGATVLTPATDVPTLGRTATLADPQGAVFSIMKPLPPAEE